MDSERVLGIDACKGGWIGITLDGGVVRGYAAGTIDDLVTDVAADGSPAVVAIDIPIGMPDHGLRTADLEARKAVGRLRSSVFMTPVRGTLNETRHDVASAINRRHAGQGMSIQAFGILPKVREVDTWLRRTRCRVVEVHPEVSFAALAGKPLTVRKSTWAGVQERCRLLREVGIDVPANLGMAGLRAGVDDVLDAAVAAWTARRVSQGKAETLPEHPQEFSDGRSAAIWR
jgi:predicted RNase H-like nuclease